MFTVAKFGYEGLTTNELGEKTKGVVWLNPPLSVSEKSVNRSEFYQAMRSGMKADKVVSVNKFEYITLMEDHERRFAEVTNPITGNKLVYTVVREFDNDTDVIELTLQRGIQNAST